MELNRPGDEVSLPYTGRDLEMDGEKGYGRKSCRVKRGYMFLSLLTGSRQELCLSRKNQQVREREAICP